MNAILQKRIEEAARDFNRKEGIPYALTGHVFNAFIEGATFALQNQWISVEKALPDVDGHSYSKPVLVMSDTNELLVATYSKIYDKWNSIGPLSYHRLVVTHWMEIPSLKGGGE